MKKILKEVFLNYYRIKNYLTPSEFLRKTKLEIKIEEDLAEQTLKNFKEHFKNSLLFRDKWEIRKYAIETALLNDLNNDYFYLELGVFKGRGANFFSRFVKKLYAFDNFYEGLSEDWIGMHRPKGDMKLKKLPKLNSNVVPVVGMVEETLDEFLEKNNPKINFVHLDMVTYSPTKFALEKIKPYLTKGAILIFNELYNFIGWQNGDYKALKEVFNDDEFEYKAFRINAKICVIQLKNIKNL